jgi:hypothetical protein
MEREGLHQSRTEIIKPIEIEIIDPDRSANSLLNNPTI